jgi:hypothetical protein
MNEFSDSDNDSGSDIAIADSSEESLNLESCDEILDEAFRKCQSQYDTKVNELMEVNNDISDAEAMAMCIRIWKVHTGRLC